LVSKHVGGSCESPLVPPLLLPRKPREANRGLPLPVALHEELREFLVLAIGKGVHRVDDDRLDTLTEPRSQNVINDRHDVREALPSPYRWLGRRTSFACLPDRLGLVGNGE